jgi:putative CocE/NonD family hydrolase
MVPIAASSENFTVTHPDGAFGLETRLRWSQGIHALSQGHRRPIREQLAQRFFAGAESSLHAAFLHLPLLEADTVAAGEPISFYRDILVHSQPDEPFWAARDHSAAVAQVTASVHLIGGWYDYYLRGLLRDYASLRATGRQPYLTIGPWFHSHPAVLTTGLREGLTWFNAQLKGDRCRLRSKPVRIYIMGADQWRDLEDFPPPARETRYYLQDGGLLARDQPPLKSTSARYRYDPADPTPALGGALLAPRGAGAQDNRPLEARPDVLCYTTAPITEEIEVIGPMRLELYADSNQAHTDFFGRLCDVSPDGRSTNVCDGLFRVEPGQGNQRSDGTLLIQVDLWATAYRFRRGHRLRLQISSGAHPHWSRNLGTRESVASGTGMTIAQQTIYHGPDHPSVLVLPIIS